MSQARRAFAASPVASLLATGFGSGLSPVMPGTAGSLVGLALAGLVVHGLAPHTGSVGQAVGLLMSGLAVGGLGVVVSGPVCRALAAKDPGCVVIDEIAGQFLACVAVPLLPARTSVGFAAAGWIGAFLLFRFFDIVKPGPIRLLQDLPGGWGVVLDDVAGGIAATAALAGAGWLAVRLGWI